MAVVYYTRKWLRLYVNGAEAATLTGLNDAKEGFTDSPTGSPRDAFVGTQRFGVNPLRGFFRDFRVYSSVLS